MPELLGEPYERDVLWIDADFLASLSQMFPWETAPDQKIPTMIRTAGTKWEFLEELFQAGVKEEEEKKPGWETMVVAGCLRILVYLDRACREHTAGALKAEKPDLMGNVAAYIETHYAEHITIYELSRRFYVSESTISHLFKQKMGISIYHYLTQRRLISAKNLIAAGIALEQVGSKVGFSDYSAFYRAFKQEYGISPRQYRNLQEGKNT